MKIRLMIGETDASEMILELRFGGSILTAARMLEAELISEIIPEPGDMVRLMVDGKEYFSGILLACKKKGNSVYIEAADKGIYLMRNYAFKEYKGTAQSIAAQVCAEFGIETEELAKKTELLVLSPGVPTDLPFVLKLKEQGVPIWGEIELAYLCGKGSILAITGTNGKTTTTSLVGEIFKRHTDNNFTVGNIGIPYTEVALQMNEESYTVAEISSFQLETIDEFKPHVSAVLNVTPDHLNRHYTMENYASVKLDVCRNQTAEDYLILNYDDEITKAMAKALAEK